MTDLTYKVINCGLHDETCDCYAISTQEANAAIVAVKMAIIEAVKESDKDILTREQVIRLIMGVS